MVENGNNISSIGNKDSTITAYDIEERYFDSIKSIPCVTLLDTVMQDISIKISCLYANQLAMEATIGNTKSYDTVNYPLYHHCRDGLILYNGKNNYSFGNFCWFANGKYGVFGVITGWRWSIHVYPLLLNENNQLTFGDYAGVNPYSGFVDIKKSQLLLHSGYPSLFFETETDSGYMDNYYREVYRFNISNKGLQLKKTIAITDDCVNEKYYCDFDEDIQIAVKYYLQIRKIDKDCIDLTQIAPEKREVVYPMANRINHYPIATETVQLIK